MNRHQQAGAMNKMLMIVVSLILLLLLTVVGGGAWAVSSGRLDLSSLFQEPPPPPVQMSETPLFKDLDKFVVSLANERTQHYMMLELSLVSHDPRMPEQAEALNSVIRNALLKQFAGMTRSEVREQMAAMDQLQAQLQTSLVAAAESYGQPLAIEEVLVTNVVIQ